LAPRPLHQQGRPGSFASAESWMGFKPVPALCRCVASGPGYAKRPCRAQRGKLVPENLLPAIAAAIRQARCFSDAFPPQRPAPSICAPQWAPRIAHRAVAMRCLLDEEPSGHLSHSRRTPLSEQEIGQVLRVSVAPPLPGSSGPSSEELRLPWPGAQETRPCSTPSLVQLGCRIGTVGNGDSARSPEPPPPEAKYEKPKVDHGLVGDHACSLAQFSLQKISHVFWPSATWPFCWIHSQGKFLHRART